MNSARILSLLKNCDSQNPMSLSMLGKKSGLSADSMIRVAEEMYDSRIINRCTVTRSGITQVMVWPVGVIPKADVTKLLRNYPIQEEELQEEPTVESGKTKTRTMLEMIAENGEVTVSDLASAVGTTSVKAFLLGQIKRGLLVFTEESRGKVCALAPGVTPEQLLADGRSKSVKQKPVSKQPEPKHVVHFVAPPDQIEEVTEGQVEEETSVCEKTINSSPRHSRFRLASTSDGTLMLFGLGSEPIELDVDQTNFLVKFVTSGVLVHG